MSQLLELLGRGLVGELSAAYKDLLHDDEQTSTDELFHAVRAERADAAARVRLGSRLLRQQKTIQARKVFEDALRLSSANLAARAGLACALDELGHTLEATGHLEAAIIEHPDHVANWFALGFCREKLQDIKGARDAYLECTRRCPQLRNPYERLAAIAVTQDDLDTAIDQYEHLCACAPDDVNASLVLANLYARAGQHESAISRYHFALALQPDLWEARNDLASSLLAGDQLTEAIEKLEEIVEERPGCAEHHVRLGDAYAKAGRSDDALAAYEQALSINPDYLEARIKTGTAYLRRGQNVEAAQAFGEAVEVNDRILGAYVGMGVAQLAMGQSQEAESSFELACSLEPNSSTLFSEIARLQLKVCAATQAQSYLAVEAIKDAPKGPLGPKFRDLLDEQIHNLSTAIREHPGYADLHYRLGLLYRHKGELMSAIESFRAAVAINPTYSKAIIKLGLALRDAGRVQPAIDVLRRALDVDPEAIDLHYQLGLLYADRGEFRAAVHHFELACEANPDNADFQGNLALALQNMNLMDRAEGAWNALAEALPKTSRGRSILQELDL